MNATTGKRERLAKAPEVAEHLGVSLQCLYGWRVSGQGPPAIKVGKLLRYDMAVVEAWQAEQTSQGAGGAT